MFCGLLYYRFFHSLIPNNRQQLIAVATNSVIILQRFGQLFNRFITQNVHIFELYVTAQQRFIRFLGFSCIKDDPQPAISLIRRTGGHSSVHNSIANESALLFLLGFGGVNDCSTIYAHIILNERKFFFDRLFLNWLNLCGLLFDGLLLNWLNLCRLLYLNILFQIQLDSIIGKFYHYFLDFGFNFLSFNLLSKYTGRENNGEHHHNRENQTQYTILIHHNLLCMRSLVLSGV